MATKYDLQDTIRSGNEMGVLADEFRPRLEARCEAGLIDGMKADVPLLESATTAATTIRTEKKASTMGQNEALKEGADVLGLLRNSISTHFPAERSVLADFGVGMKFSEASVPGVTAAIEKFLGGNKTHGEKARAAGVLPDDITILETVRDTLTTRDRMQEKKKVSSKAVTKERNAAHARVEKALDKIHAISQIVFRNEPEIRARFDSAMPMSRAAKNAAKRKAAKKAPKAA